MITHPFITVQSVNALFTVHAWDKDRDSVIFHVTITSGAIKDLHLAVHMSTDEVVALGQTLIDFGKTVATAARLRS